MNYIHSESKHVVHQMDTTSHQQMDDQVRQLRHDVLNCLNVIGMSAQLLKSGPSEADEVVELSESIDQERKRAAELLDQLVAALERADT